MSQWDGRWAAINQRYVKGVAVKRKSAAGVGPCTCCCSSRRLRSTVVWVQGKLGGRGLVLMWAQKLVLMWAQKLVLMWVLVSVLHWVLWRPDS